MTADVLQRWTDADGRGLAGGRAGPGEFVAVVQKSPARAADASCEDAGALVAWGDRTCALIVADGFGGHAHGALAARTVVGAVCDRLAPVDGDPQSIQSAVLSGIESANQRLLQRGDGAATTILAVVLDRDRLRSYHAGDSELLVVGQRGKVKRQTISHSPVGYAVEAGVLEAREGFAHADRHLVSNFVGMEGMHVQVGSAVRLAARDTLVMASDGLWDNLHLEEVAEVVRKGPLARAAEQLVRDSTRRMRGEDREVAGKPDDLTVVLWRRR